MSSAATPPDPRASTTMLSVEHVAKNFATVRAVDDVSFEVRGGEVFGFLGPNGAGKTTTLRMIMGITRPDHGRVSFAGAARLDPSRVGYLPEERGLFEDVKVIDVLQYLGSLRGMTGHDARNQATRWLARMELADRARHKVGTLSKGNQQKVQFAAAVLHRPMLAVLDEPFSGLDPLNQELFLGLIGELRAEGAAVLLSAHQLGLVERLCDRFLLISRGRSLLSGTLDEMRRAATGDTELLRLDLRPRSGAADARAVSEILRREAGRDPAVEPADGRLTARVEWPAAHDLGPVLTALAGSYVVDRVEMRPPSLHEIYVLAIGGDLRSATRESAGAGSPA
jgi:ABC-2 type transport system ATP-binding protein